MSLGSPATTRFTFDTEHRKLAAGNIFEQVNRDLLLRLFQRSGDTHAHLRVNSIYSGTNPNPDPNPNPNPNPNPDPDPNLNLNLNLNPDPDPSRALQELQHWSRHQHLQAKEELMIRLWRRVMRFYSR